MPPLSETIKQLIHKARIVSFAPWREIYAPETIALFQSADDNGRYLTDEDIAQLRIIAPQMSYGLTIAKELRDRASEFVAAARAEVLRQFPEITQPGGGLYPPERAEACWRDFWHFLRCISYGVAGQQIHYTSTEGLGYMQQLYQELKVPLPAMIVGLQQLKKTSMEQLQSATSDPLAPYFDHLIVQLQQFQ